MGRRRPRLQGPPAARRRLRLLGHVLVRRRVRRHHLRLRLLLARAVRLRRAHRHPRGRLHPGLVLPLRARPVEDRRRVAGVGLRARHDALPRARAGPLRAGAGADAGRPRAARAPPARVGGAAGRPRHLREPDGTGGRGAVRAHGPHRPAGGAAALRCCSPPPSPRPSSCASPSASGSRSRASYLNETSQLMVFLGFALVGAGAGRRERRPSAPALHRALPRVRGPLRRVVHHPRQPDRQQQRSLLHGLRAAAPSPAAPHAAAPAVPLRRARDHPHRAVRPPAVRHRHQSLPQRRRAPADHARVLRPRARRRQGPV